MSGRGRHGDGRGVCISTVCGGICRHNYSGSNSASKKGLCTDIGNNMLDYGHKAAADQIRTTWEKLVQYVGTK